MSRIAILGVRSLEMFDLRATDVPARTDNAGDRFVDLGLQFQVGRFKIEKRDHFIFPLSIQ